MTEGSNFNKPHDDARERGLVRRAPEPGVSFVYTEPKARTLEADALRAERADVLVAEKEKEDALRKTISQKEAREQRDIPPSVQREQHYLAIIKKLDKELGQMMDLAQDYRILYGAEISEDADAEKRHGFKDSFLGRFFTRSKEKKEARKKAEEKGFYGAWVFQNRWKELSEELIEKAKELPFSGDRAALQENLHAFFKLPTRSAASVLWEAFYKDFLDLTVLAPITAPLDVYKEIKKTARNEVRMQGEAMGRRTSELAEQILENESFEKTREAIAEAFGKPSERLNTEDVLEYLYTTDHGQEILRLEQAQNEENQTISRMDVAARALYEKTELTRHALRGFLMGDAKIQFLQVHRSIEKITKAMQKTPLRIKEKIVFEKRLQELKDGIEKAYTLGGRKEILSETYTDLRRIQETVADLLERSRMSDEGRARANRILETRSRQALIELSKLLPIEALPESLEVEQEKARTMIDAIKNEVMPFCLAQAKASVQRSIESYIPVTNPWKKEAENKKLEQLYGHIAFFLRDRTSPIEALRKDTLRREAELLQKTNSLSLVHLEAKILADLSEIYQMLENIKLISEKTDLTDLIKLTEHLTMNLSALDRRGELVRSIVGDLLSWDQLLFGGYLGGDLGKKVVEETITRTGDWRTAVRELNQTKVAWLLGRKLTIHTDREYQPVMAKRQILRVLPEGYKEQAEYILRTLEDHANRE